MQLARQILVVGLLAMPGAVWANPLDISLRGLGRPTQAGLDDPAVRRYRALTSELVLAIAPRPMQPAETLGMSGFEFSIANSITGINNSAAHWQGQPGNPVLEGALTGRDVPGVLWVPTVHLRKGLPLSTELGVSGSYLAYSEMFMLGAELKIALYESYVRWIPAVAGRLAVGRLFGSSDLDIVTAEADGIVSLPFGVGGMVQLTPFAGAGVLFAHVNSQVLDETPQAVTSPLDQKGGPNGSLYTFPTLEWQNNAFTRLFFGLRVNIAMIELLYELDVGLISFNDTQLFTNTIKIGFDT